MSMAVTCCACEPSLWGSYPLVKFVQDVQEVMFYIAPLVLCVVLWKLLVTNRSTPRGDVTVLGLDVSTSTYSPRPKQLTALLLRGKAENGTT